MNYRLVVVPATQPYNTALLQGTFYFYTALSVALEKSIKNYGEALEKPVLQLGGKEIRPPVTLGKKADNDSPRTSIRS
jgi:hypothetical protein